MGTDVLADIEWFKKERGDDAPIILTLYHGTTHAFDTFSGERVNYENMFGRQIYFSSSEDDAERNYASLDGPDLKNRMEHHAELAWNAEEHDSYEDALSAMREMFYGGQEAVITAEVTLRKPLILGVNQPHGLVIEDDELRALAVARVAEEEGVDPDTVAEDDDYLDLVDEAEMAIRDEDFERFSASVSEVIDRLKMTRARDDTDSVLYELLRDNWTADAVFEAAREKEPYIYLFDDENYVSCCVPVLAELCHLAGHDAIVRLNADKACHNMEMEPETAHIALSVDNLDQVRIIERRELTAGYDMGM